MHATRLTDARRALAHLRLAMASGDPEGLVEQLTDLRDPDRTTNRRRVSWGVSGASPAPCAMRRRPEAPLQYLAGRSPSVPAQRGRPTHQEVHPDRSAATARDFDRAGRVSHRGSNESGSSVTK